MPTDVCLGFRTDDRHGAARLSCWRRLPPWPTPSWNRASPRRAAACRPARWTCRSPTTAGSIAHARASPSRVPTTPRSVLKIAPTARPTDRDQHRTDGARCLCRALAGAGDRRPHHPRRRALHRYGPLARGAADRPVRLSVDRHPRPDHRSRSRWRWAACCSSRCCCARSLAQLGSAGQAHRAHLHHDRRLERPRTGGLRSRDRRAADARCWSAPSISRSPMCCARISPSPGW